MSIDLGAQRESCNPQDILGTGVLTCDSQCMSPHYSAFLCNVDVGPRLAAQGLSGIGCWDFVRVSLGLKLRSHAWMVKHFADSQPWLIWFAFPSLPPCLRGKGKLYFAVSKPQLLAPVLRTSSSWAKGTGVEGTGCL